MPASRALVCLDCVVWKRYTHGMTSHRDCTHPKTKAARARCRKNQAARAEDLAKLEAEEKAYYEAYIRPHEEQEKARIEWETMREKFAEAHINSAEQNADDTAHEEGFDPQSKRWYECAMSTLQLARDCADRCLDLQDPQSGQLLEGPNGEYHWIDRVWYGKNWQDCRLVLVDEDGKRTEVVVNDLMG